MLENGGNGPRDIFDKSTNENIFGVTEGNVHGVSEHHNVLGMTDYGTVSGGDFVSIDTLADLDDAGNVIDVATAAADPDLLEAAGNALKELFDWLS